jgi:septum formation protein
VETAATKIVLASASPRRRLLLSRAGIPFEVEVSGVPEDPLPGEQPEALARRLAREKALAVRTRRPGAWILGADTVVALDGEALGKPSDASEARAMLARLSGRSHRVITAFVVLDPEGRIRAERAVLTTVEFRQLAQDEIEAYVATGEPFGKAGGYAVQGRGGQFVARLQGSESNVVGLPMEELVDTLAALGLVGVQGKKR